MAGEKRHDGSGIWVVYALIFIAILTAAGCSSKKEEKKTEESYPAKTDGNNPAENNEIQVAEPPALVLPEANGAAEVNQAEVNQTARESNEACGAGISTDAFLKEFNKTSDSERKVERLRSLFDRASEQDPCVIGIVRAAVTEEDANVALEAIELLQGYESPEVLPAIVNAMAHPNEEVRQTAVRMLSDINDPQTGVLLATALSDESEDVRSSAIDITKYKDEQVQFKVLEAAISSPFSDIKDESVFMLEYLGGHRAIDILIEALQDRDTEFRESAASAISMLIDKEFESYKEAKAWWEKNKNKYDKDLSHY